ncbi:MAG: SDR family NAD(P)-dependent oxidoreductase [Gemmatimonadetes bacterium]|nr:SDR family NAD(P)-dependent oxidoreductase [Gemmatimonadota bacterium]
MTGASSGIGRKIAERLATEGFYVYAGARKAEDIAELSKIPNMKGVRLDVTSASDLTAAVALVEREKGAGCTAWSTTPASPWAGRWCRPRRRSCSRYST